MIEGVKVIPLKRIPDERGTVHHMLCATDPHFLGFGEIYFSTVYPGVVKGWHRHTEMSLNYCLVQIPPGVWNGFKGIGTREAMVANACTHAHDPSRSTRLDPHENHIPYEWGVREH